MLLVGFRIIYIIVPVGQEILLRDTAAKGCQAPSKSQYDAPQLTFIMIDFSY